MRWTRVAGAASRRTTKYSSAPTALKEVLHVIVGLERLGDEQEALASVAVQRARGLHMAAPLLVGQGGMRPDERLDVDRGVGDVVVRECVGERRQHRVLARAGRSGDDDGEHVPGGAGQVWSPAGGVGVTRGSVAGVLGPGAGLRRPFRMVRQPAGGRDGIGPVLLLLLRRARTIRAAAYFYGSSLLKKMLLGPLPSVEPKSDPRSLPSGVRPM
jgi:hypothetical protein